MFWFISFISAAEPDIMQNFEEVTTYDIENIVSDYDADKVMALKEGFYLCAVKMSFEEVAAYFINTAISKMNLTISQPQYNTKIFYQRLSDAFFNKNASISEMEEMIKDYYLNILTFSRSYYG